MKWDQIKKHCHVLQSVLDDPSSFKHHTTIKPSKHHLKSHLKTIIFFGKAMNSPAHHIWALYHLWRPMPGRPPWATGATCAGTRSLRTSMPTTCFCWLLGLTRNLYLWTWWSQVKEKKSVLNRCEDVKGMDHFVDVFDDIFRFIDDSVLWFIELWHLMMFVNLQKVL